MKHTKQLYLITYGLLSLLLAGLLGACGAENQPTTATGATTDKAVVVTLPTTSTAINATTSTTAAIAATTASSTNAPATTAASTTTAAAKAAATTAAVQYPKPALTIPQQGATRPVPEFSGTGELTERDFYSNILQKTEPYRIYLPADYHTSQKRYPVLYLLHGYSGQITEWMQYGLFDRYEELLAKNAVNQFIIVLPCGEQEYWVDHPNGGAAWGEYMAEEVVAHIDGNYRTIPLKESRAIGGLSMGGNGALQVAMNYPNIFGIIGAHSPTMRTFDQKIPWWGDLNWFLAHDPVAMVKTNQYISQVKLWIDDADGDTVWRPRVLQMKGYLDDRKIQYDWHSWPGGHEGGYWGTHLPDYLQWYNSVLDFKN